jgi:hypothetical protein
MSLSIEMTNTRRKSDSKRARKEVFRKGKKQRIVPLWQETVDVL